MSFSQEYLSEFDHEMESTRKLLECVPEEKFAWKPHDRSMSLASLAGHISDMVGWGDLVISQDKLELTPDNMPQAPTTKAGLMQSLESNIGKSRKAIEGASDAQLAKNWEFLYGGHAIFSMPRTQVLRSVVLNHVIHHRGQLSVYLRLLDVKIPGMYGPSADA
jgi:uncharacterized damage-inducible protein DinB